MSTPTPQSEKAPRRSERRQKKLLSVEDTVLGTTSSETDVAKLHTLSNAQSSAPGPKQAKAHRKPQAKKHPQQPDSEGGEPHHAKPRQQSKPDKAAATPLKPAYAASTFLKSPAPSSLPMPSFYSKSVPNTAILGDSQEGKDNAAISTEELIVPPVENGFPIRHRESTPLDFLFEAARKAQGTPRAESPNTKSQSVSVRAESPYDRSPAPREGGAVFPFEFEENSDRSEDPTHLTPFRENNEPLRPQTAPARSLPQHETDRKAKTEALKKLLMNVQPLRAASVSPRPLDPNNPFNARPAPTRNMRQDQTQPHYRHHSGPSTPLPYHHGHNRPPHIGFDGPTDIQNGNFQSPTYTQRPPSSQLRNIYQPSPISSTKFFDDNEYTGPLISTARKHDLRNHTPREAPVGMETPEPTPPPKSNRRADSSAQQLEDDLRRVLKLDLPSKG